MLDDLTHTIAFAALVERNYDCTEEPRISL
jgi:hypothetical protein